jgi:hypothetical protein
LYIFVYFDLILRLPQHRKSKICEKKIGRFKI